MTIAVIDTGIAYETYGVYVQAPDLAGTTFVPGWDFVNNDAHPNDDEGHGTHVAGTLAQTTNNSYGLAGIAFGARLMPLKVLNDQGTGSDQVVADAIVWATDHGAQVLNLSLGGTAAGSVLRQAVDYAYNHGVVVVAAAGNGSCKAVEYPAAYANAIAVAAIRFDKTRAYYSNCGPELDVAAPGGDLNVDQNGDGYGDGILQQTFSPGKYGTFGYWFYHGTSMATPHVAAVAALLISQGYATTPDAVRAVLAHTALDLGAAGRDNEFGWGLIQANDALIYAAASPTATPSPSPTTTATASPSATPSATTSPTATATPSSTATPSATPTATPTATSSATPSPTPTSVSCALPGDVNCDCTVDIVDIMTVASRWGTTAGDPLYDAAYDFDANGTIDIIDIMFVATRFLDQCATSGE
ncbi:MAG: S8 family serine peptidase [Chloroflexi bacterium]|nr:S8 family serine peptidase [Chloroflexota bacterium]